MKHRAMLKTKLSPITAGLTCKITATVLSIALVGCGALLHRTPEDAVKHRANQRWQAMLVKDFKKAYGYFSPFKRGITSEAAYLREIGDGNAWLAAEVISVTCEPQTCKSRVRLEVASPMPSKFGDKITTHIDEDWVLVDGEWWYSQR